MNSKEKSCEITNIQSTIDFWRSFQFWSFKLYWKIFISAIFSWSNCIDMIYGSYFTNIVWDSSLNSYSKLHFTINIYNFGNLGSLWFWRGSKSILILNIEKIQMYQWHKIIYLIIQIVVDSFFFLYFLEPFLQVCFWFLELFFVNILLS